jgi:hypothetical protein
MGPLGAPVAPNIAIGKTRQIPCAITAAGLPGRTKRVRRVRALAFAVRRSEVTWLSRAIAGVVSRAADFNAADRRSSFIIQFLHWYGSGHVFEIAATKATQRSG